MSRSKEILFSPEATRTRRPVMRRGREGLIMVDVGEKGSFEIALNDRGRWFFFTAFGMGDFQKTVDI